MESAASEMSMFIGSPAYSKELIIETHMSINPNYSVFYNSVRRVDGESMLKTKDMFKLPELNRYYGIFSEKAKSRLKKALNWLIHIAKPKRIQIKGKKFSYKLTLITVSLPAQQVHEDKEIAKCLSQLLIEFQQNYNMQYYIWKAEKQKNGSIHYHITSDCYVPHQELRERWSRIINKLGYVDMYRKTQMEWHKKGFKPRPDLYFKKTKNGEFELDDKGNRIKNWSLAKQKESYRQQMLLPENERWRLPNCTDVHSVKGVKNLVAYLAEYLAKNDLTESEIHELKEMQDLIHLKRFELKRIVNQYEKRDKGMNELEIGLQILEEEKRKLQNEKNSYHNSQKTNRSKISDLTVSINDADYKITQIKKDYDSILSENQYFEQKKTLEFQISEMWNNLIKKYGKRIVIGDLWSCSQSLSSISLNENLSKGSEINDEVTDLLTNKNIEVVECGQYSKVVKAKVEKLRENGYNYIYRLFENKIKELRELQKIVKPKEIELYWKDDQERIKWYVDMNKQNHKDNLKIVGCTLSTGECHKYIAETCEDFEANTSFERVKLMGSNVFSLSVKEFEEVSTNNKLIRVMNDKNIRLFSLGKALNVNKPIGLKQYDTIILKVGKKEIEKRVKSFVVNNGVFTWNLE